MSEPLRSETSRAQEPTSRAERDAKIEHLLLTGLDYYFAQQYEQAINVWTRALFLDRSHARARAYIERARSAQAERQRESEALLHDGADAIRRGDRAEARRLLDEAMSHGGPSDEVLALLDRVERLDDVTGNGVGESDGDTPRLVLATDAPVPGAQLPRSVLLACGVIVLAALVIALAMLRTGWEPLVERSLARRFDRAATVAPPALVAVPVPRRSENALARARLLVAGGKLRDALPVLESIRPTDPERAEADRLRADVQRQLIALGPLPTAASPRQLDGVVP
ncbi:MAG: hypothetical protein JSU08_20540 [Acidobacteria bacterium]|nr:hypothetical protein [Acidobacteriota bacterium]